MNKQTIKDIVISLSEQREIIEQQEQSQKEQKQEYLKMNTVSRHRERRFLEEYGNQIDLCDFDNCSLRD